MQQIKNEAFLEDLSALLSSGDIPNLFPADEKAEILEKVSAAARTIGIISFMFIIGFYSRLFSPDQSARLMTFILGFQLFRQVSNLIFALVII